MTVIGTASSRHSALRPKLTIKAAEKVAEKSSRPLTATLEKPFVLNIALMAKLDMSVLTKQGLLAISKLCAVPLLSRNRPAINFNAVPPRVKHLKPAEVKKKKRVTGIDTQCKGVKIVEPCKACGRPEQPERLHSHPATASTSMANYKSAGKMRGPRVAEDVEQLKGVQKVEARAQSAGGGRPRMVVCYICAREFGTASFPIHEPKCIEKWERENANLPAPLRRKLPQRPHMNGAGWNQMAWQSSQAALVPCPQCGRTFYPDRLVVHSRSCNKGAVEVPPEAGVSGVTFTRPPTVPCYLCGREFGTKSIAIHEPQCLKKWRLENAALPQALQRSEPTKPGTLDVAKITGCYICGVSVAPKDRPAHEQKCLQQWKKTNNAKPEAQRLVEPIRPDYRFTRNGSLDGSGTWHSIWTNHMDSLIACRKCSRKFFPDRIEKHEAVCQNACVRNPPHLTSKHRIVKFN